MAMLSVCAVCAARNVVAIKSAQIKSTQAAVKTQPRRVLRFFFLFPFLVSFLVSFLVFRFAFVAGSGSGSGFVRLNCEPFIQFNDGSAFACDEQRFANLRFLLMDWRAACA